MLSASTGLVRLLRAGSWHLHPQAAASVTAEEPTGSWKKVPGTPLSRLPSRRTYPVKAQYKNCFVVRQRDLIPGEEYLEDPTATELEGGPHRPAPPNLSVIEYDELGPELKTDRTGLLFSLTATAKLLIRTNKLAAAMHDDTVAFAVPGRVYLASSDMKVKARFAQQFARGARHKTKPVISAQLNRLRNNPLHLSFRGVPIGSTFHPEESNDVTGSEQKAMFQLRSSWARIGRFGRVERR